MKNIKDLKEDILKKEAGNVFLFNGNEWAVKKHYIEKISEDYPVVKYLRDTVELVDNISTRGRLRKKTLYVVPHDLDFIKASAKDIKSVLDKAEKAKDGIIWVYSTELTKSFTEHFDKYITEFEEVEEDIFKELVLHEMKLQPDHVNKLSANCKRNYGMALLEIDKIRNYAQYENVSNDVAFEDLYMNHLLIEEKDIFNCQEFMNHLILKDFMGLEHSLKCLYDSNFENVWYHLEEMINDFKILYCFIKFGKWDGGSKAYNEEKLYWGRIKELRDFILPWGRRTATGEVVQSTDEYARRFDTICLAPWTAEDVQYMILKLSECDYKVKQGKMTDREVIENIFYYLI